MNLARQVELNALSGPRHAVASDAARAVLRTLAYSDLFDYPLTVGEIWRYQAGTDFSVEELASVLSNDLSVRSRVSRRGELFCLRGREHVFDVRVQRMEASRPVWRRARLYARIVSRMPFVRMVAVTGALAMDNLGEIADIDFMIVAEEGRVWICRRLIIGLVRLARLAGDDLCPNYIISDRSLSLDQRDLFTAHELVQMVPMYGERVYRALLTQNAWAGEYLPVASREPLIQGADEPRRILVRPAERLLRMRVFSEWETWEMERMQSRLRPTIGDDAEVVCSPQQCKGHTGRHRHWITARYKQRLSDLGLHESDV